MWNEIKTNKDIESFMSEYGYFHDSCLKELRFVSGAYVNEELSMMPVNTNRDLYIVFQKQSRGPAAIEMFFEGVEWLNLKPVNEDYTSEILGAYMCIEDGIFVWFDDDNFKDDYREMYEKNNITCVKAHKVSWRAADEFLGKEAVYGNVRR